MARTAFGKRAGTQSIERAVLVLKEITARSKFGWRPSDLAAKCGLDRGTTHRILACLVRARLVQQRSGDRHYIPGPLIFEMSLSMPSYTEWRSACQPILSRLAKQLSGYALLCVRSGGETVCIASAGTPAYLGTAFDVGTRRPLTATAAGVAILVAMPPNEAQGIVDHHLRSADMPSEPGRTALRRMWRRSQSAGYGINQGFTARNIHAVGVPLRDIDHRPFGSIALAAGSSSMPAARIPDVAEILRSEAKSIERLVRQAFPEGAYNASA
jgi:DNA-binding IclR family transcriptional regulator